MSLSLFSWLSEQEEFPSALQIPSSTANSRIAEPESEGATARAGTSSTERRNPDLTRGHVHHGCVGGGTSWVAHTRSGFSDFKAKIVTLVFPFAQAGEDNEM